MSKKCIFIHFFKCINDIIIKVMYMINEVKDNSIIICSNSIKNTILLNMSKNKIIKKIKFIDINEFKKLYGEDKIKDAIDDL